MNNHHVVPTAQLQQLGGVGWLLMGEGKAEALPLIASTVAQA